MRLVPVGDLQLLGQGRAPGMAQQARQFGRRFDRAGKLRHRREEWRVRNFLVRIAVLERRLLVQREPAEEVHDVRIEGY